MNVNDVCGWRAHDDSSIPHNLVPKQLHEIGVAVIAKRIACAYNLAALRPAIFIERLVTMSITSKYGNK